MFFWFETEDVNRKEKVKKAINLARVDSFQLYKDPTRDNYAVIAMFGSQKEYLKRFDDFEEADKFAQKIVALADKAAEGRLEAVPEAK